jgi:hypothetical protein
MNLESVNIFQAQTIRGAAKVPELNGKLGDDGLR